MSVLALNITKEALQLPRQARARIAEKLSERPDLDQPFEGSDECRQESARRCLELDERTPDLVPADQDLKRSGEAPRKATQCT